MLANLKLTIQKKLKRDDPPPAILNEAASGADAAGPSSGARGTNVAQRGKGKKKRKGTGVC